MQIKEFENETDFIEKTIQLIKNICQKNGPIRIALSGGNTPQPIYKALAKENLPWEKMEFYIVDERYVPIEHKDSNFKMINQTLISKISAKSFRYFDTSLPIPECLEKYKNELPEKPFDLIILGIGPDGHTASLFPNSPALKKPSSPVAHTQTDKFAVKDRLTLTFSIILSGKNILVLLNKKPEVLKELQNPTKNNKTFPALTLLKHKKITIFHSH